MPSLKLRLRSAVPFSLVAGLMFGVLGCGGGDGVQVYTAPKEAGGPAQQPGPGGGGAAAGEYRLLGLMLPADNPVWFFKYNGPAEDLNKHEADFDKLAASVKLTGGEPEFTPPEGWKRGPGRDGFVKVFATVLTNDEKQEVSITQSGGGVETNLNRWVGMIGLRPAADDTAKYTKVIDGMGVKVRRIDLRGPKNPATNRGPMMGGK